MRSRKVLTSGMSAMIRRDEKEDTSWSGNFGYVGLGERGGMKCGCL
jgi:hypothetical protein